jgi:hypothetical protein
MEGISRNYRASGAELAAPAFLAAVEVVDMCSDLPSKRISSQFR